MKDKIVCYALAPSFSLSRVPSFQHSSRPRTRLWTTAPSYASLTLSLVLDATCTFSFLIPTLQSGPNANQTASWSQPHNRRNGPTGRLGDASSKQHVARVRPRISCGKRYAAKRKRDRSCCGRSSHWLATVTAGLPNSRLPIPAASRRYPNPGRPHAFSVWTSTIGTFV